MVPVLCPLAKLSAVLGWKLKTLMEELNGVLIS